MSAGKVGLDVGVAVGVPGGALIESFVNNGYAWVMALGGAMLMLGRLYVVYQEIRRNRRERENDDDRS